MTTWVDAWNIMRGSMAKANGVAPPSDIPRVTNEQAASILRASMNVATKLRLGEDVTPQWYALSLALAGWRQPGDKFLVTEAHRRALLPDGALPVLWQTALSVANAAQSRGVAFTAPTVNPAVDYKVVLQRAWEKMQRDAKADQQPAPASPLPELPASSAAPSKGSGNLWLGLALAWAASKGKI